MNLMLGRYELVESLGQGGMGEVWLAKLTGAAGFQKACLVKTVLPGLKKDPQFVQRFMHEAKVLVHLQHSNIAQVYDMGDEAGTLYMALEFVQGVDVAHLQDAIISANEVMPVPVALHIAEQAAEGLGYAHRRKSPEGTPLDIIHRDVSPQNIMVSYDGEVKVIDFGIAKSAARTSATGQATVMGKLGYMAPEQAQAAPLDGRADQYSLGVVLWELLTGQAYIPPGSVAEMVTAMSNPRAPRLSSVRSEVDAQLEAVIMRALAVEPGKRYPRTDDFARALADELHRLGRPSKEQVGQYVTAKCEVQFEAQKRLMSRLSTLKPLAAIQLDQQVVHPQEATTAPHQTILPVAAAMPVVPSVPVVVPKSHVGLFVAVGLGSLLVGVVGVWLAMRDGEPKPEPTPVVEAVKPVPVVIAPMVDAGAAEDAGEEIAEPVVVPRVMKATLKLQRSPVWSLTVTNESSFTWTSCTVYVPGGRSTHFASLNIGFARELPVQQFAADAKAPALTDEVMIRCAQGTLKLIARE